MTAGLHPGAADPLLLQVQHVTHYRYSAPVSLAHHMAHLQPVDDEHQSLLDFRLDIDPPADAGADAAGDPQGHSETGSQTARTPGAPLQAPTDADGRPEQRFFSLSRPHRHLRVQASSRVRVVPRFTGLVPEQAPAWDTLAQSLCYQPGAAYEPAVQFRFPSPFVPRATGLRTLAEPHFPAGLPVAQGALALMQHIHRSFKYETDSTRIDTPLTQVLTDRRGVCQDFAHLMIGALRMLGLPARYVSGYLLTQPPEGGPALVGADATHAWVQLWCPGTPGVAATGSGAGWLDLDPTNNRVPAAGHVRLALGRDFGDVTPLSGVIRGGGQHTLTVGVSTLALDRA